MREAWQPTPVLLPGESLWTGETNGLQSVGSQRVMTEGQSTEINNSRFFSPLGAHLCVCAS